MSRSFEFEPFDIGDAGSLIDETEFEIEADLPVLPPRYRRDRPGWWTTTESEEHHLDLPPFSSGADRARWMVAEMGRAALASTEGAGEDDRVFPTTDGLKSLHELLRGAGGADAVEEAVAILEDGRSWRGV